MVAPPLLPHSKASEFRRYIECEEIVAHSNFEGRAGLPLATSGSGSLGGNHRSLLGTASKRDHVPPIGARVRSLRAEADALRPSYADASSHRDQEPGVRSADRSRYPGAATPRCAMIELMEGWGAGYTVD